MENIIIQGGKKLSGKIAISGAKNSALPLMAATLLTADDVVLDNVPIEGYFLHQRCKRAKTRFAIHFGVGHRRI